jgi:hypothetical protein
MTMNLADVAAEAVTARSINDVQKSTPRTFSPTSPTRFRNTVVSAVYAQKFPLHFALDYFGRQFETQLFEKDLLVISRF